MNEKNKIYMDNNISTVSDLALAAVLHLYFPVIHIYRDDDKKVYFIFEKSDKLKEITEKYWIGKIKVIPKDYYASLKTLKSMIHNR